MPQKYVSREEENGITQALLKEIFDYDPEGFLVRNGVRVGIPDRDGYGRIGINKKSYKAHRLIFLYHHGYCPPVVDHRDRDRENNKIENLRASDHTKNNANRPAHRNSASKYKGVWKSPKTAKLPWTAAIRKEHQTYNLGTYATEEEAAEAYNEKCLELYGEHALLNEIDCNKEVACGTQTRRGRKPLTRYAGFPGDSQSPPVCSPNSIPHGSAPD